MKTNVRFLGITLLMLTMIGGAEVLAQGRNHGDSNKGRGNDHRNEQSHSYNNPSRGNRPDYNQNKGNDHRNDQNHSFNNPSRGNRSDYNQHKRNGNDHWNQSTNFHSSNYHNYNNGRYYRPPHWATNYNYHKRPRYVFYRDYNTYYDCFRGVYITFYNGRWTFSNQIPLPMRRINFSTIAYIDLDYYGDDLPYYVGRRW